jgi:hypothetical protein
VLLGTRYHQWAPTSEDVRAAFIRAYLDGATLTRAEQQELEEHSAAVLNSQGWH